MGKADEVELDIEPTTRERYSMMRCYVVIFLVLGSSTLTACGGASNGVFGPLAPTANARPLSDVVYSFAGSPDAARPEAGLLAGKKGEYYGTSVEGGSSKCNGIGCGTVYEITAAGKEKVIYSFRGSPDGASPQSMLISDKEGALYGTTAGGGGSYNCDGPCGTVFKVKPGKQGWTDSVLYAFQPGNDGWGPVGGLVMTKSGALLGAAAGGGANGDGVVFELTPSQSAYSETIVHTFAGSPDGANPTKGLVSDSTGNLYGATVRGGLRSCRRGCGTVFKLTPSGSTYIYSVIYRFKRGTDGRYPSASLLPAPNGVLYGLTERGGTVNRGTVFELVRKGAHYREKLLYSFKGGSDGSAPDDTPGLVADRSGNLYGTTVGGGGATGCYYEGGCGTVFKLVPYGSGFTESVLYAFQSKPDGANPDGSVVIDHTGNLLGSTFYGGSSADGTIFSIAP